LILDWGFSISKPPMLVSVAILALLSLLIATDHAD